MIWEEQRTLTCKDDILFNCINEDLKHVGLGEKVIQLLGY